MKNNSAPFILRLLLASSLVAIALPVAAQIPPPTDAEGILAPAYTGKSYSGTDKLTSADKHNLANFVQATTAFHSLNALILRLL